MHTLDGDSLYSRSDPSDLDVVEIEVQLPLYDHDSHSDSSHSEEDSLEALPLLFRYYRYRTKPGNSQYI